MEEKSLLQGKSLPRLDPTHQVAVKSTTINFPSLPARSTIDSISWRDSGVWTAPPRSLAIEGRRWLTPNKPRVGGWSAETEGGVHVDFFVAGGWTGNAALANCHRTRKTNEESRLMVWFCWKRCCRFIYCFSCQVQMRLSTRYCAGSLCIGWWLPLLGNNLSVSAGIFLWRVSKFAIATMQLLKTIALVLRSKRLLLGELSSEIWG